MTGKTTINYNSIAEPVALAIDAGDGTTKMISVLDPMPMELPSQAAAAWVTGSTPQDARSFGLVEFQVAGLIGGDTIAVTRSLDGTNYAPVAWLDGINGTGTTITADQIYSFDGGGYLKWAKSGSAGTPTVIVRAAS